MKKTLLLCFIAITFLPLSAQDFNSARHRYKNQTTNMVSINSKSFYMEASGLDSLNLVGLDNNGQTLFKTKLNSSYALMNKPFKILKTLDKKLLTLGWQMSGSCDAPYGSTVFISKSDTTGATVFQSIISLQGTGGLAGGFDVTQHPDSSYYVINRYNNVAIYHYSKTGVAMSSITTTFSDMNSITALANGNLLVNGTQNNVLKNAQLNATTGNIINQQNTTYTVTGFTESPNNLLYALETNGSIRTYSANLQPLNNFTLGQNMRIKDLKLRNDSVFCTGSLLPFNMPYYAILGTNLNILYQTQSAYKGVVPTGIAINNKNKISIISMGASASNTVFTFSGLFQTSTTGSFMPGSDVGVVGHSVLTSTVYYAFTNMGGYGRHVAMDLAVQVKNFGTDTVKSFNLNYFQGDYCPYYHHKKYTATIAPNSVITVTTGVFITQLVAPPNVQNTTYTFQTCLFTTVPNSHNDTNIDNDNWCGPVEVFVPMSIPENNLTDPSVSLYPNPVQHAFTIETDNTIHKVEVFTVTGALMHSGAGDSSTLQIETESWPKGIYFLKLKTEKGSSVKKLVKD